MAARIVACINTLNLLLLNLSIYFSEKERCHLSNSWAMLWVIFTVRCRIVIFLAGSTDTLDLLLFIVVHCYACVAAAAAADAAVSVSVDIAVVVVIVAVLTFCSYLGIMIAWSTLRAYCLSVSHAGNRY